MNNRSLILPLLLLGILVWATYWNSLDNPFHFDDFHVISENPAVRSITDVPSFFLDPATFSILPGNRDYRPLFLTSMALSWQAGGGTTRAFHLGSIAIHMGVVFLLFLIFRLLYSSEGSQAIAISVENRMWAAFAGAGIFALHPLASEPVNYISSQSVLLAAFFYLLSFYIFLNVYQDSAPHSPARLWLLRIGSYTAYFLGFLCKPIVITLPVVLLLWEWLMAKADTTPSKLPAVFLQRLRKHFLYWGITLFYLTIRQSLLPQAFGAAAARTVWVHYLTQTRALVCYYLKYAFYPIGLNVDPEFPLSNSLFEGGVLFSLFVLIAIVFLVFKYRRHGLVVFWVLWFPACLLVTTYLTVLGQLVNEHRVYLSMAGISALAGLFIAWLWQRFPLRFSDISIGPRSGKMITTLFVLSIFIFLGLNTRARNEVWASDFNLWQDAALNDGTWRAHMNYGLALEDAGRSEEAFAQFKEAVNLFAGAYSHINLGLAYIRRNEKEKGIAHLRQAVSLWPDLPEAHLYLGYGLEKTGRLEEAEKELQEALRLRTNFLKGYRLLAEFYERQGKPRQASSIYQKVLDLDASQSWAQIRISHLATKLEKKPGATFDRGYQQIAAGDYSGVVVLLEKAYPNNSQDSELLFNLAFSHQKLANRIKAIRYYEALLKVAPNHVKGNFNLAFAYLAGSSNRDLSRSAVLFKKVLELDPGYSEALFRLASVYWKLGDENKARRFDELYLKKGGHEELKNRSRSRLAKK